MTLDDTGRVQKFIAAGFEPESATQAVAADDLLLLRHTGLYPTDGYQSLPDWGPFHTQDTVARRLGITDEEVARTADAGDLLRCFTSEGTALYPVWQFNGTGINYRIRTVLNEFEDCNVSPWLILHWCEASDIAAHLGDDAPPNPEVTTALILAARSCAARWSR